MKKYLIELREKILHDLDTSISGMKVADVIFFPGHMHPPMVRIDGSGMSEQRAAEIEALQFEIMVRLPDLVMSNFDDLLRHAAEKFSGQEIVKADEQFGSSLNDRILEWLANSGMDLDGLMLWEVDVSDNDIAVRLIGVEKRIGEKTVRDIEGIKVEILPDLCGPEGKAMLRAFDLSKGMDRPFLRYWSSLLNL